MLWNTILRLIPFDSFIPLIFLIISHGMARYT